MLWQPWQSKMQLGAEFAEKGKIKYLKKVILDGDLSEGTLQITLQMHLAPATPTLELIHQITTLIWLVP